MANAKVASRSDGAAINTGSCVSAAANWLASFSVAARAADSNIPFTLPSLKSSAADPVSMATSVMPVPLPTCTGQPRRKASIARAAFLAAKSLKCETP